MISNERQLKCARAKLAALRNSLEAAEKSPQISREPHRRAGIGSIQSLVDELVREIAEYERVTAGEVGDCSLDSLHDLPRALILARLRRNWTQEQLAEVLDVPPQAVQRDEQGGYERATLSRLVRVADTLGIRIRGTASFSDPQAPERRGTRDDGHPVTANPAAGSS